MSTPSPARTLGEIRSDLLRVECLRCFRIVEIQRPDAVRLYGPHAIWKDVGHRLLDDGCRHRTGRHEEDGCWPDFKSRRWKIIHSGGKIFICGGVGAKLFNADQMKPDIASARFMGS
jgi:hypothetical protein